jgi:CRISPR-associated endonuclease Csn1
MELEFFREEAKKHLENTLISIKAKNKVTTNNINKTKREKGYNKITQQTPRGQLHNETIYGRSKKYVTKIETIGSKFNSEKIQTVANKKYREAIQKRLSEFDNDPKKAFTGKNSLKKVPIQIDEINFVPEKVKTVTFEYIYTIRKEITHELNIEKIVYKSLI